MGNETPIIGILMYIIGVFLFILTLLKCKNSNNKY